MELSMGKLNKRYMFFYNKKAKKNLNYFKGIIKIIHNNQIVIDKWEENGVLKEGTVSVPKHWIEKIITLDNIIEDTILPNEIVIKIDEY